MYHYKLGNTGKIFPLTLVVHVSLIVISPCNVLWMRITNGQKLATTVTINLRVSDIIANSNIPPPLLYTGKTRWLRYIWVCGREHWRETEHHGNTLSVGRGRYLWVCVTKWREGGGKGEEGERESAKDHRRSTGDIVRGVPLAGTDGDKVSQWQAMWRDTTETGLVPDGRSLSPCRQPLVEY